MTNLNTYTNQSILDLISQRKGETKLGEKLIFPKLEDFKGKYVIIGIPEDIGPRANCGNSGAKNTWKAFLKYLLNTQFNSFINNKNFLILGEINLESDPKIDLQSLRKKVETLDNIVYPIIQYIKELGKIPIIIGGGHNNAYPIIKGVALAQNSLISVLNIDPHADLRPLEGRHSGNGFSYAKEHDFLNKYFVLGLHEQYNSEHILNQFNSIREFNFYSFDSMLREGKVIHNYTDTALDFISDKQIGLEIDLDSLANFPVSARTPSGISIEDLRKTIFNIKKRVNFHYIHICEAAPNNQEEEMIVGKALSYIVLDIIKD